MSRVIVITSGKGGVGKTTITANLGTALACMDKTVVLVDADFGLRNLDLLLGLENRIVYNALDVIKGDCRLEQALIKDKRTRKLDLLAAAQTRTKAAVTTAEMAKLIKQLITRYDYVLIDCPAGIEQGFQNAVVGAKEAIVVTTPELTATRDADRVIGLLEAAQVRSTRLVINRARPDLMASGQLMSIAQVKDLLAIPLLGVVPEEPSILISSNKGEPIVLAKHPPLAAMAIQNIAERLQGNSVPLLDLNHLEPGLMGRIKKFFSQKVI